MNNQLIPVFSGELSSTPVQLVDARLLHEFLEVGKDFSTWLKKRIADYGFVQGIDFKAPQNGGALESTAYGKDKIDYYLTLDMAKELGMIERNDKGRQIRRYFLDIEKAAKAPIAPPQTNAQQQLEVLKRYTLRNNKRWQKIIYYKNLKLNHAEIAKIIGLNVSTVRANVRQMEACGLLARPYQLDLFGGAQ